MASRRLKRLPIDQRIKERLNKQNFIQCQDVLVKTELELIKILGLNIQDVRSLIQAVSQAVCPIEVKTFDLWEMKEGSPFLPTSLSALDETLHGGLAPGTITEIAGPSGCGKTQFCIMLSVLAASRKESDTIAGSVLYIDTESAFNPKRLLEVAQNRLPRTFCSQERLDRLSKSVHVCHESTCASLLERLDNIEDIIIEKKINLVIMDSVASLVRKEFDTRNSKNMIERTNLLAKQASVLKNIAEAFKIPVVVTNQITTRFGNDVTVEDGDQVADEGKVTMQTEGYVTAALGNTWSHCVNTRLIVQYLDGPYRQILIAKSPIAPFAQFVYRIKKEGLVLEEDGAFRYEGTDPGLQRIRTRAPLHLSAFGEAQF